MSHVGCNVKFAQTHSPKCRTLLSQACANLGLEVLFAGDPSHSFACACSNVFPSIFPMTFAREMLHLLAIAATPCAVTGPFHRQKGWGQQAQITLRRAESFLSFIVSQLSCKKNAPVVCLCV